LQTKNLHVGYNFSKHDEKEYFVDEEFVNENQDCWEIIKFLSNNPFVTQKEICERFNLSKDELIEKNKKIRETDWTQDYIINTGVGSKYWKNTIIPTIQSGKANAVLDEKYAYPDRVGLCPGISCNFFCYFCGRNYSAVYEKEWGEKGFEMYKQIIDQTPKGVNKKKVYHITGGLEPLTFPRIGDLVSYGEKAGFDMEIQTNGSYLTSGFIEKHPGIKDLSVLRISLYGVDNDSTFEVTKNKKAYDVVKENLINYLKLDTKTKLGLNYVILHKRTKDILKLLDYIEEINIKSNNQVDFLTLREDFAEEAENILGEERQKIYNIFNEVQKRLESKNLNKLHIDYGYALESIRKNQNSDQRGLEKVDYKQLRPKAFPQIAVMVDPKGDVFAYHEATFLDREGAKRYCIGTVDKEHSMKDVIKEFVENSNGITDPLPHDENYLDAFDHVITVFLNQAEDDIKFGIPWSKGPVKVESNLNFE
jgi:dTDP-4-amino-4,6-dideoxy-D-glucose ammonia-lyase